MFKYLFRIITCVTATFYAMTSIQAQTGTVEPVTDFAACEIHIWASDQFMATIPGALAGFGVIGALIDSQTQSRARTAQEVMAEYLGSTTQFDALAIADVPNAVGKPGMRVILEHEMLTVDRRKTLTKDMKRLSSSETPCYSEFIVGVLWMQRTPLEGSQLLTGFVYREYSANAKTLVWEGIVKNPAKHFPPKTPEDAPQAKADLHDAVANGAKEWFIKKLKRKK